MAQASVKDGKITIPSKTFIGINPEIAYYTYMWGADLVYEGEVLKGNSTDEVVFSYDAGARKFCSATVSAPSISICSLSMRK